jgi:isoleucyl-tRNA synthetase
VFSVLNEKGIMNERAGEFEGQFYLKADPLILEKLKANKSLINHEDITHSYPHD